MTASRRKGLPNGQGSRLRKAALSFACAAALGAVAFVASAPEAIAQGAGARAPSAPTVAQAQKEQRKTAAAAQQGRRAQAQPKAAPKGFIETIMEGPRFTTTPPEAADWVRATRPDPNARTVRTAPAPGRAVMTADQIRAQEAQLDRLRASHDKVAGRKAPTGRFGSAAGKPESPTAEKYKPGCTLTCSNPISVPRTQRK
ncbi:MAG: hypothetical protein ACK4MV_09835 [Beijerinckiaceae bacterium]